MTASRDELLHLIAELSDDEVDVLLADVRRLNATRWHPAWPPRFAGMIKNGPVDGSSPERLDAVLSRGFGNEHGQ